MSVTTAANKFAIAVAPVQPGSPILTFLAILVNDFRKIINVIVIIVSGLVALFGYNLVPYKAYVIVAAFAGLLTAFILTNIKKNYE